MYAPIIEDVYNNFGSGQGNFLMWGISPTDNNAQIVAYKIAHGITNPCAGTQGGGPAAKDVVIEGQNFLGYPTYCVVCPDKSMYFDACYPPTVNCFTPYIETCMDMAVTAAFSGTPVSGCDNLTTTFTDESTGSVTSWSWTFEGGNPASSAEQNPVVTFEMPGVYDVSLTVSNGTLNNTETKTGYIQVFSLPIVTIDLPDTVCVEDPAFTLTGGLPEGGTYSGTGVSNNIFDPAAAGVGSHIVTYTYEDLNDCQNAAEAIIYVEVCSGIGENRDSRLALYPNPATNQVVIRSSENGINNLKVIDILGTVVIEMNPDSQDMASGLRLDTGKFEPGIYFVVLNAAKGTVTAKLRIIR